jgi:hypothetical protein
MFVFLNCAKSKDKKERIEHEHRTPYVAPQAVRPAPSIKFTADRSGSTSGSTSRE